MIALGDPGSYIQSYFDFEFYADWYSYRQHGKWPPEAQMEEFIKEGKKIEYIPNKPQDKH